MWTIDQILKDLFPHGIPPEAYRHLDLILEMAARGRRRRSHRPLGKPICLHARRALEPEVMMR